jgi:hypothetical protein
MITNALDMPNLLGEVVVLVQSESGSDSGSDTQIATEPDTETETDPNTPLETDTRLDTDPDLGATAFNPVTFPADRIHDWMQRISIPEDRELETAPLIETDPHTETNSHSLHELQPASEPRNIPEYEPLVETQATDTTVDPECTAVLETCAQLLSKLEEVRLAVLHLQYSLHVGTAVRTAEDITVSREPPPVQTQDRAQRLWSWDHAGVFLAELPCP